MLTEEAETSLITLYAKAVESRMSDSILRDSFADGAIRELDYDFSRLQVDPDSIIGIAVRAKILDEWTQEFLAANPMALVLHLGCGLDSRVFRLDPPRSVYWCEVDLPEVIALRRSIYPARLGCHLLGSSVTGRSWLDKLPAGRPTMIVAEGLLLYLKEHEVQHLLSRLTSHFKRGQLAFDCYDRFSLELLKASPMIRVTGASLQWGMDDPRELETLVPSLQCEEELIRFDPAQIARLSWFMRTAIWCREMIPPLHQSCGLLRYRFDDCQECARGHRDAEKRISVLQPT
jgi:O-methyltransferase involved in polyketide biosynthesis